MFCTTLRKRHEWGSVPSELLSQTGPKWQEKKLEAHDLAIPLPQGGLGDRSQLFRIILLSSEDMKDMTKVMARIERLYNYTGGQYVGIFFLLEDVNTTPENGLRAFMTLQAELISSPFEIPIIPLHTVSALQTTLLAFQRQVIHTQNSTFLHKPDPLKVLLPFCSLGGMPEHTRNILSDICHSIPELAQAATTKDGQEGLRSWIEQPGQPDQTGNLVAFWEQEYVVD